MIELQESLEKKLGAVHLNAFKVMSAAGQERIALIPHHRQLAS